MGLELFPFQEVGRDWLSTKKVALLADDMGLGKTAQAISAADRAGAMRVLVVCPAVARINWRREFRNVSPGRRELHVCQNGAEAPPVGASAVASYDLAVRFQKAQAWNGGFDLVILDEVHFCKSVDAKRTQLIFGKNGLVRNCKRIWALTGTPMPNGNPAELWVLLVTFGRTKLSYAQFVQKFCILAPGSYIHDTRYQIVGARKEAIPELQEMLRPIMLRRRKEDVALELPSISFSDVIVERRPVVLRDHSSFIQYAFPTDRSEDLLAKMCKQANRLETEMEAIGINSDDFGLTMEGMAASLPELRRYTGLQKIDSVAEMLDWELLCNYYDKVVVFAIHRDVIEGLRQRLVKYHPVTLYGRTDPKTRQRNVDKFQTDKKTRIFIANIHAAGTAITLTRSSQVVFVEQSWTPADNAQAAMRVHRIGQKSPVMVRFVGLCDSIDEKIANILNRKTRDILSVFDGADGTEPGLID